MVKVRLARVGAKNQPYYRIVVVPDRTKRNGKVLEIIGHFDPRHKTLSCDKERLQYWQKTGAQLTDAVTNILVGKRQKPPEQKKPKRKKSHEEKKENRENTTEEKPEETEKR